MKQLYINIASETESRDLTEAEFKRVGLNVERVDAIVGDNRPLAFNQSVYKCMEIFKGGDGLLFEDDVVFDTPPPPHLPLDLPADYMTLHFGCNIIGMDTTVWKMPEYYAPGLAKLWNCWQSHATLYSAECVKFILDNLRTDVLDEHNNIFDDWLRRNVLSMGRSYVLNPMICYQRPRKSEIWNCHADYTGAHKQGNEYLRKL